MVLGKKLDQVCTIKYKLVLPAFFYLYIFQYIIRMLLNLLMERSREYYNFIIVMKNTHVS
jgi:hypothetical protein